VERRAVLGFIPSVRWVITDPVRDWRQRPESRLASTRAGRVPPRGSDRGRPPSATRRRPPPRASSRRLSGGSPAPSPRAWPYGGSDSMCLAGRSAPEHVDKDLQWASASGVRMASRRLACRTPSSAMR
jgi:hypothetical protein